MFAISVQPISRDVPVGTQVNLGCFVTGGMSVPLRYSAQLIKLPSLVLGTETNNYTGEFQYNIVVSESDSGRYMWVVSDGVVSINSDVFNVNYYEDSNGNMQTIFDGGDPRIVLYPDGMDFNFVDGWPEIDSGLENSSVISLLAERSKSFDVIASTAIETSGSEFLEESRKSITVNQIKVIEDAAEKAFSPMIEDGVILSASAKISLENGRHSLVVVLTPPVGSRQELLFMRDGQNWVNQRNR